MPLTVSRDAYRAAIEHAALIDRSDRGRIVVAGSDRASYLQGLLTNDIAALKPGEGCYAAYLTAQGRMITDLWVYELGDVILVTTGLSEKDALLAKLDQFVFSEDVQLGDVTSTFNGVAVVGPDAARVVSAAIPDLDESVLRSLSEHGNRRTTFASQPAIVLRVTDTGLPGFEVLVDPSQRTTLEAGLRSAGATDVDPAIAETLRIEGGIPRFRRDMDEETIPLEAGIEDRAISLTKGCYVGQEVIIRVLHRGHGRVAKKLVGLTFDGDQVPPVPSSVRVDEKEVGRITSSTMSPALDRPIALAYLHRDFLAPGTGVCVNGTSAVVTALPFVVRA